MVEITVKENGTDGSDTAVWNKVDLINNSDVDFGYINVSPEFDIKMKDEVTLLDFNQNQIFGGYVRDINNQALKETIVFGYDVLLTDIEIQKNFEGFSPEGIIQFCVELAGLTYNSTVNSGLIIDLYPAKDKKLKNIIDDMLNVLGAVSRVDFNKNYYLEYAGATTNPITLQIGSNCVMNDGWNLDTENLCTQVKVKGVVEEIKTDETFSGTGSQTEFILSNVYVNIKVEHPIGTELKPEISGVQSGDYRIEKETQKVIFNVAPASGTDNILVTYDYEREITYTESSELILPDKSNLHQKTIKKDYLKTIEDVRAYAADYLNKFSQPLISATLEYSTNLEINDFSINQNINVVDNTRKVNGEFVNRTLIIKRIRREFGADGASLLIDVGENTEFVFNRRIEQENRLKQLEENITSAELLQFGIKTTDSARITLSTEIYKLQKVEKGDAWILDDATNSQLDAGFKLDGGTVTDLI